MYLFSLIFITNLIYLSQQNACDFNLELVTDLIPQICYEKTDDTGGKYYYTNEDCLPFCKKFQSSKPEPCDPQNLCVPGYECNNKKCEQNLDSCALYYVPYTDNQYYNTVTRPNCDKDGLFAPKQCKGEPTTGRCFCADPFGNRLFGQEWTPLSSNQTCACSRRKWELRQKDTHYFVSLHCDSTGNFEPLQCDTVSEQCWCADSQTGDIKSTVVPMSALNRLPCYDSLFVGSQYLRQCDSIDFARKQILYQLALHGTTKSSFGTLLCDEDGAYGQYKIFDGIAYCTWRDNANISPWQSGGNEDIEKLTCNCARDSIRYQLEGQTLIQKCSGNGNYDPYQKFGNDAYCVDNEGFKNSLTPPQQPEDCIDITRRFSHKI